LPAPYLQEFAWDAQKMYKLPNPNLATWTIPEVEQKGNGVHNGHRQKILWLLCEAFGKYRSLEVLISPLARTIITYLG
jgi:hypothetical protein